MLWNISPNFYYLKSRLLCTSVSIVPLSITSPIKNWGFSFLSGLFNTNLFKAHNLEPVNFSMAALFLWQKNSWQVGWVVGQNLRSFSPHTPALSKPSKLKRAKFQNIAGLAIKNLTDGFQRF